MDRITKQTVLLEQYRPYTFEELPDLLASGLQSSYDARAAAALNIADDLRRRVDEGSLVVRNPLDLGQHTLPIGNSLKQSVLFPWEVGRLLEERGIQFILVHERCGPELWTIRMAAESLGAQQRWHNDTIDSFTERLVEAGGTGELRVRDAHTDLPYRPSEVREFWHLVTPADVNAWLAAQQVNYRWSPEVSDEPKVTLESSERTNEAKLLGKRERDTLLILIAAACQRGGLDFGQRGVAAELARFTETLGCAVSHDTIRRALDQIPEAMRDRSA